MNRKHVVIVGGGITGLAAAYRLRQLNAKGAAITCTLIESCDRLGGKIATKITNDYTLELGPDSIYTRKPTGTQLIREIGLENQMIAVNSGGGTLIWHNGELQPLPPGVSTGVPSDLAAMAKTKLLSTEGKARALADLLLPLSPLHGDVAIGHLLRKRLGNEVVDILAAPLLAGIHAGDIDRMSLDAVMPMWRTLYEEHRSLILAAVTLKKKAQAAPFPAAVPQPLFINLRGGLNQLVDQLRHEISDFADVRLHTRAVGVAPAQDGKHTVTTLYEGDTDTLAADAVILAIPAFTAAELLGALAIDLRPLQAIRYAHTATVSFGYHNPPAALQMNTSGFLVPRNEGATITACTIVSNKWSNAVTNGDLLVRCYVGRDGDEAAVDWEDDRLIQAVRRDLHNSMGLNAQPDFVEIKRWHHSMPQYDVGHLERVQAMEAELATHPRILLVGAAYRGIGIPDCIKDATRAVERLQTLWTSTTESHRAPRNNAQYSKD